MSDELKRLQERTHKKLTVFDYDQKKIPCIILDEKQFDQMLHSIAGKPVSVDTNLNILQDGLGHVFVEVSLDFSEGGMKEKILINANESLEFFELLAQNAMLAISSPNSTTGRDNVFMIQLPKPEKAINALEIIKRGLTPR